MLSSVHCFGCSEELFSTGLAGSLLVSSVSVALFSPLVFEVWLSSVEVLSLSSGFASVFGWSSLSF
ncbi:hypothetical protein FJO69_00190 [[Mycoplasma] falconis]|uniref:Uncharacterized protein n=1 Tax=[Mycoplasma] falconis TaxID=92403 RepID=A0A501XBZ2_9BACT|nr:hypothetical protein [[Mycoplasma] falconis]TPE58022.1 hypothetical protein FJO69_00190 [[Mycoplasma] falconis]